jgi:hypothetical protein
MDAAIAGISQCGSVATAARAQGVSRSTFRGWHEAAQRREEEQKPLPIDTAPFLAKLKAKRHQRLVITWAQNATPVHKPFLLALERFCRENRAQLIVIPGRYKNPTSRYTRDLDEDNWWDEAVEPYLLDKKFEVNKNLVILADIKIQPTAVRPLTGFETISGSRSAVMGHAKIELKTVPTPHEREAKIITTTGACTKKNYIDSKAGKKGEFHHIHGAALIEVDGDYFYLRQLNATQDGSFIDLDREYTPTGSRKAPPAAAIMLGDVHVQFADPTATSATFGKGGMVATLKPKQLVWHDVLDFYSRSHHHRGDVFTNLAKHRAGMDDVAAELDLTFGYMDQHTPPGVQNIVVASNHHEHFRRWISECDPRQDPKNLMLWAETFLAMGAAAHMAPGGAATIDPFAFWGKKRLKCAARTRFLRRDESYLIKGIEHGFHSDYGPNGSRGSIVSFTRIGSKANIGHGHGPGICDSVYQGGTLSRLKRDFLRGPSGWMHTNIVTYGNGKRCLYTSINGRYRLCQR